MHNRTKSGKIECKVPSCRRVARVLIERPVGRLRARHALCKEHAAQALRHHGRQATVIMEAPRGFRERITWTHLGSPLGPRVVAESEIHQIVD